MMKQIDPDSQSSRHRALNDEVFRLMHSNQFRYDVLSRFAPAYAAAPLQALREEQFKERKRAQAQKTNLAIIVTALLMLALPFMYLLLGERTGAPGRRHPDPAYPFQLPGSLTPAKVLRKLLYIEFDCGLVYDKEVWTETVTTHYYHPGQSYTVNGTTYTTAGNYTSNTTTITYHKYFLRTPDGREIWRQFTGDMFPASKGQVVSTVDCGDDVLFAFNHNDGTFVTLGRGINPRAAHEVWPLVVARHRGHRLPRRYRHDLSAPLRRRHGVARLLRHPCGHGVLFRALHPGPEATRLRCPPRAVPSSVAVQIPRIHGSKDAYLERAYSAPDRAAARG